MSGVPLRFALPEGGELRVVPTRLAIAGWTGRDSAAVEHHIEELAKLGVPRPSTVPLYYRAARSLLTQDDELEMLGDASSGEVEPVLLRAQRRWWLTVGSDHTDRAFEAHAVDASKQLCGKPLAREAWAWDDVAAHADKLLLRSRIHEGGEWVTYQEGPLARIRPLMSLAAGLPADLRGAGDAVAMTGASVADGATATASDAAGTASDVHDGLVLFCGTLAAIPRTADGTAVRPAPRMQLELLDPVRQRRLHHEVRVTPLPRVA